MKSVPLLPVYQQAANNYAATTNKYYDQEVADYAKANDKSDYYNYLLSQAKLKNIDENIFEGLEDAEDKFNKLFGATLADDKEIKEDWGLEFINEGGEKENFKGTQVEYIDKLIELKQEYKKQEQDLAMAQAKKDAMSGWERAWSNIGAFFGETAIGAEQFVAGLTEFIEFIAGGANWLVTGKYEDIGLTEGVDWQANQLADFERRYTDYRDINGNLTTTGKIWTTIGQGIGQQIPAAVANLVVPGSGYALLYAGSAAGSFNEYITKTDVNVFEAAFKVAISTGLEMAIEKGLGKMWGETGADIAKYGKFTEDTAARSLVKSITTKAGAGVIGKAALHGLKDVAQESLEEFLQEWSNVVVDWVAAKCDSGFKSDVEDICNENGTFNIGKAFERTLFAGLAGAAGAGFFGGIGKISYERNLSKATGNSIFNKEYVVDENGKTRKLNFFEKIALQTDVRGIYERIQMAREGNLSQEARTEIWETTVMLGDFFNSLSKEDLDESLKLFNEIHDYAEEMGKKLSQINTVLDSKTGKISLEDLNEVNSWNKAYKSGKVDQNFGNHLLEQIYKAQIEARQKGLAEVEQRKAENQLAKAQKDVQETEAAAAKTVEKGTVTQEDLEDIDNPIEPESEVEKAGKRLAKAFANSQRKARTEEEIRNDTMKQWVTKSKEAIGEEIKAINDGKRPYGVKEAQIVREVLKSLYNATQLNKNGKPKKLTNKEQKEIDKAKQEAEKLEKQKAELARLEKLDKKQKEAKATYEKAPIHKVLKAMLALQNGKTEEDQVKWRVLNDIYQDKKNKALAKYSKKAFGIKQKYIGLTEEKLENKIKELQKKATLSEATEKDVVEYELVNGMKSVFQEYRTLLENEMHDAHNARTLTLEQNQRNQEINKDEEQMTFGDIYYVLYGNKWQKFDASLNNSETKEQLAKDLVTEINPLLDLEKQILANNGGENNAEANVIKQFQEAIETTGRAIEVTNGNKIIVDENTVFLPKAVLKEGKLEFVKDQIVQEDLVNKAIDVYLRPILSGNEKDANPLQRKNYQRFLDMRYYFQKELQGVKPSNEEDPNRFFMKMMFTDMGAKALIKNMDPSQYRESIQYFFTLVIGLEKELGKFGKAYQKLGNQIFKTFHDTILGWVRENFARTEFGFNKVLANPQDFAGLLTPSEIEQLMTYRKEIRRFADTASYTGIADIYDPALLTTEDYKMDLDNMGKKNAYAKDIKNIIDGKTSYQNLPENHPIKEYFELKRKGAKEAEEAKRSGISKAEEISMAYLWSEFDKQGLIDYVNSNKDGNAIYPRACKTNAIGWNSYQIQAVIDCEKGDTCVVPLVATANNSKTEIAAGSDTNWKIIIQNQKYAPRTYAPIVDPNNQQLVIYKPGQRFEIIKKDEKRKRVVIQPVKEKAFDNVGKVNTKNFGGWRNAISGLKDSDKFSFPVFDKTTFNFLPEKNLSLANILKDNLDPLTKENINVTDMVKYPLDVLSKDFINYINDNFGYPNVANTYMAIRRWLLDNSNGNIGLTLDSTGERYQLINLAPVIQHLTDFGKSLHVDKQGTRLFYQLMRSFDDKDTISLGYLFKGLPPRIADIPIHIVIKESDLGYSYPTGSTGSEGIFKQGFKDYEVHKYPDVTIELNVWENQTIDNQNLLYVIAHEVQHVIQDYYGFAPGGNVNFEVPLVIRKSILKSEVLRKEFFKNLYKRQNKTYDKKEETLLIKKILSGNLSKSEDSVVNRSFAFVTYSHMAGEVQSSLNEEEKDIYPFVVFFQGDSVEIRDYDGNIAYGDITKDSMKIQPRPLKGTEEEEGKLDMEYGVWDYENKPKYRNTSAYVDPEWWEGLDADERKKSRSTTEIKRSNYLFKKYYEYKRKRLDKRVQGFLEDIKDEEGLNRLPKDLAALIREDAATYDDLIYWFKTAKDIDEDTFKLFVDNIFPGTNIKSFEELQNLTLKLGYAVDENGNIQLDSKGNPKENVFRNRGQVFSPDFDKYRAALMEHYDPSEGLKGMQKYVRQAEYLGRQVMASDVKADEEDKREFGDDSQISETLEEEVFGERDRLELSVAKYMAIEAKENYKNGKITKEELDDILADLRPNEDGFIEQFENLSDEKLKQLEQQLINKAANKIGGMEAAERKANQTEINKKSESQLSLEKTTRRGLRKVAEVLGYMTDEEINDLIGSDAQYFHRDENGKLVYHVSGKYSLTENVQEARENLLNRLRGHLEEWKAKQEGRKEAYKLAKQVKQEQAKQEEQKKKVEVITVEPNKVAPINQINLKVGNKVVEFKSTVNLVPKSLQKIFNNTFSNSNLKENEELHFGEVRLSEFMKNNGVEISNLDTQDWLAPLEFFEQTEMEGNSPEANAYRETRLYSLYSMVLLMKFGRTVMNKDYVTRANNLMNKESLTGKERSTWKVLMERVNKNSKTKNTVLSTNAYIPEKVQDEFETAMATSVDGSDENFAKAVADLKKAIKEEHEATEAKKSKAQKTWDKILSFRYTAMLSSPMTWFRNAFSNRVVKVMNKWSEKIGNALFGKKIPIDKHTEKILRWENQDVGFGEKARVPIMGKKQGDYILVGTKVDPKISKWINTNLINNGLLHELTEGYSKYDPDKRMNNLSGVNYIVETMIDNYRKQYNLDHTFKTKAFNWFHKFVTKMISDEKFINEATLRYFGKMLTEDVQKDRLSMSRLEKSDMLDAQVSEIFAKAQWLAFTDYMRNGNFVTKWMSELGKGDSPFAKYAIPLVAPFAQSSVNWWAETMRYSPFGLVKSIINLVKYDKYVAKMDTRRQVRGEIATPEGFDRYLLIRNLGKGVLGTSLYAIGFMLSAMGIAGLSKKKDKYVLTLLGDKIEVDISKYFNSSSVIAGIATLDSIKQVAKGQNKDWTSVFSNVLNAYGETLFLSDLLGEYRYSDGLGGYVKDLPYNFIYSMVPNIMKLTARVTHVGKTQYASGFVGDLQKLLAGIPGMPYLLDQWSGVQVDPYTGKKYKGWGLVENIASQFGINNSGKNYFGISDVEKEAIKHDVSAKNLDGKIKVGEKEYTFNKTQMNETSGKYVNELVGKLINGEVRYNGKSYGKMNNEEQKEAIKYYINEAHKYAKIETWTSNGHKYYASEEMYRTLKNLGITNVYLGSSGYVE